MCTQTHAKQPPPCHIREGENASMTMNLVQVQDAEAQKVETGKKGKGAEAAGKGRPHWDKLWVLDSVPLTHLSSGRCPRA